MPATKLSASEVADLAQRYLDKHQPSDYKILIVREGIRVDDQGWWEIPVKPSKENVPSYDWINRTAVAAVDMDEAEGVHVLFM
jgi:hypothetical protein